MKQENEQDMLKRLLEGMGSDPKAAQTMAAQLSKRADQLSKEREVSREEALRYLVELVAKGHSGEAADAALGDPDE